MGKIDIFRCHEVSYTVSNYFWNTSFLVLRSVNWSSVGASLLFTEYLYANVAAPHAFYLSVFSSRLTFWASQVSLLFSLSSQVPVLRGHSNTGVFQLVMLFSEKQRAVVVLIPWHSMLCSLWGLLCALADGIMNHSDYMPQSIILSCGLWHIMGNHSERGEKLPT